MNGSSDVDALAKQMQSRLEREEKALMRASIRAEMEQDEEYQRRNLEKDVALMRRLDVVEWKRIRLAPPTRFAAVLRWLDSEEVHDE